MQPQESATAERKQGKEQRVQRLPGVKPKIHQHDRERPKQLLARPWQGGLGVCHHIERKQVERRRGQCPQNQHLRWQVVARNVGAQQNLQTIEEKKGSYQRFTLDAVDKQGQSSRNYERRHQYGATPLVSRGRREQPSSQDQRSHNSKERRIENMPTLKREQIF